MSLEQNAGLQTAPRPSSDFWKFWTGQTISNLGTSFTLFALPLLVFKLSGSAVNLALTTAAEFLPFLFFGLIIGAWVDRLNRKRLMIATDIGRALVIASVPTMALFNLLTVWWIYGVGFITATLTIFFDSAQFAAIPSLVNQKDLVAANGRIQASYSAATILGPLLAGMFLGLLDISNLLWFDGASFLVSALSLALIRRSFNNEKSEPKITSIRQDVAEGLRYVLKHPLLRNISLMMCLVNLVASSANAQLVLFAKERLQANDSQVGWLYSAGSLGIVLMSLAAGPLRKRFTFGVVALGALMLNGLLILAMSFTTNYWLALPLWGLGWGFGILFNINTGSLRQSIVPNHMLGRIMSIAGVLAWSAIPVGTFIGGVIIEATGRVDLVYAGIGIIAFIIPVVFWFSPLGHAERYLPDKKEEETFLAEKKVVESVKA